MLYGFDYLQKTFQRLADTRALSHAYLFYGQPQTGKFHFAHALATYLETGTFDVVTRPLQETHVIDFSTTVREAGDGAPTESVGIDAVREIEHFLYKTPALSPYRSVIIRDAHWLTDQAQNALLKILEEPPAHSLIIATAYDASVFLPPVASRFVKVYVPPLSDKEMLDFCSKYDIIKDVTSIKDAYGRIGRVVASASDTLSLVAHAQQLALRAGAVGKTSIERRAISDAVYDFVSQSPAHWTAFFEQLLLVLHRDVVRHAAALHAVVRLMAQDQLFTLSKRIHLKHIIWTIH